MRLRTVALSCLSSRVGVERREGGTLSTQVQSWELHEDGLTGLREGKGGHQVMSTRVIAFALGLLQEMDGIRETMKNGYYSLMKDGECF